MKSFPEYFQDSIDVTDGSVTMTEKDYVAIQSDARAELLQQLAELAASEATLREALRFIRSQLQGVPKFDGDHPNCLTVIATKALSTTPSTALAEYMKPWREFVEQFGPTLYEKAHRDQALELLKTIPQ